ncbi:LysR family transcriptional regulator [Pendulispora rubella]|uniref:LysR family transcriptional regulator n=1 Tax=Pendulispora rubella TaxID=2741070 RepID=A0ABZ2KWE1_9BACT
MSLLLDDPGVGMASVLAFVRTAETGSFARAAVSLGRTPSGIAKAVSRLEQRLGGALFTRTTRTLSLTECGEVVLEHARNVVESIASAEAAITAARSGPRGRLKVSVPHGLGRAVVLPSLPQFARAYPEIRVEMDFEGRPVDVVGGGYDVVLRTGKAPDSGLRAKRVGRVREILCAAPSYLARRGIPRTLEELSRHDCIRYRSPKTGRVQAWTRARDDAANVPATLVFNTADAVVFALRSGMGIAQVTECTVRTDLAEGALIPLFDEPRPDDAGRDVWLIWPADRHHQPKVRAFIDHTAALFAR